MLRSLIAHVFFLFASAVISLSGLQSARAEMPLQAWLSVAADSLDQHIGQQMELSWQSLDAIGQHAAEGFDRMMDQCRMGVAGRRGMQLVRTIELLAKLRDSVVAPVKNRSFPKQNFELQPFRAVQDDGQSHQRKDSKTAGSLITSTVRNNFSALRGRVSGSDRLLRTTLARLATQTNRAVDRIEQAVLVPAEPLVQATMQTWDSLISASADQNRAELADLSVKPREKSTISEASVEWAAGLLVNYCLEVSNSAQAKLNWLTSKVRHIAEACLKNFGPQFLILELDPTA